MPEDSANILDNKPLAITYAVLSIMGVGAVLFVGPLVAAKNNEISENTYFRGQYTEKVTNLEKNFESMVDLINRSVEENRKFRQDDVTWKIEVTRDLAVIAEKLDSFEVSQE